MSIDHGVPSSRADEFARDVEALFASRNPAIIGVRHHSALCARCMDAWLDAMAPTAVLVELPVDLGGWIPWLAHPELEAPVALSATRRGSSTSWFYPFADFSPELAALRWAARHGVRASAIDRAVGARALPLNEPSSRDAIPETEPASEAPPGRPQLLARAGFVTGHHGTEDLWDTLVEARGFGADPESVRRAALSFGRLVRADAELAGGVGHEDVLRERCMRAHIAAALARGERVVAVVGSFHAHALLEVDDVDPAAHEPDIAPADIDGSLVPYAFELLDSRSGYPAGIRDPMWQQRVFELGASAETEALVTEVALEAIGELRARGHAAGTADAIEVTRFAHDLASIRGLVQPSRAEVVQAIATTMGQGELLGRGRVLADALERAMVGRRRGRLARGTPRSGLAESVEKTFEALGLPGPHDPRSVRTEMVLDPLRSARDRERHLFFERLLALEVPYAAILVRSTFVDADTLTTRWVVEHTPSTTAYLELSGMYGATLESAAAGRLRHELSTLERRDDGSVGKRLHLATLAVHAALPDVAREMLVELVAACVREAGLPDLLATAELLERIRRGHIVGIAPELVATLDEDALLDAAVASVEGLAGSKRPEDSRALFDLVNHLIATTTFLRARLATTVVDIARSGAPRMQGAALGAGAILGCIPATELYTRVGSFVDLAVDPGSRAAMADRLRGLLDGCMGLLESLPDFERELSDRIEALGDGAFTSRLPSLRRGFSEMSPAARQRLLDSIRDRLGHVEMDVRHPRDPLVEARARTLDGEIGDILRRRGLLFAVDDESAAHGDALERPRPERPNGIALLDRWRLVLGRERARLAAGASGYATSLDALYGSGRGEGSRGSLEGDPMPSVRSWSDDLASLFDADVREEVLGHAGEQGIPAALLELGSEPVVPSVELLERVLSLRGGLGEAQLERLRPLIASIVRRLVEELSTRARPALAGLVAPQTTRRPTGVVDLRATIRRNLHTARVVGGVTTLAPERFLFRTRRKKSLDWHVVLVVDVSGSMEPSTIHAAIMASILSSLPALTVRFHAFDTRIVDLSDRVDDPLALLLEVRVGGGTNIAQAVRYARERIVVPSRTIVAVLSDFEEGGPVPVLLAEVRALLQTGAHVLGIAALDERAAPRHNVAVSRLLVEAGMPVAALTPTELARFIAEKIR